MHINIGFILLSLFMGFIIGASNTPVIAPFITAMFGFIGSVVVVEFLISKSKENSVSSKSIGNAISLIAVCLFSGALFGALYRSNAIFSQGKRLPWDTMLTPESPQEALDWIVVKEKMNSLGYSDEQVEAIYEIRVSEIVGLKKAIELEELSEVEWYERTKLYDGYSPFHGVFPSSIKPSATARGPASE